jgi:hypothetical protein
MTHDIELATIDLRYESYRLRNPGAEKRLLTSITERGIEEPLEGIDAPESKILLNGFKRYRCAKRLKIGVVPYVSLGEDEAAGILAVLRTSNDKSLSILEQARFIEDLRGMHGMSVADLAQTLSRSKAWVSMRLGLIGEMGERVRAKLFRGAFPVYSYMYTLRTFMRMNGVKKEDVEDFVEALSGKGLSVREIEQLAHGYFRGPDWFRTEILGGNFVLALDRMRAVPENAEGCSEFERVLLRDLELAQKSMARVSGKCADRRLTSRAFFAQANLVAGGILSRLGVFTKAVRALHDRTGEA